MTFVLAHMGHVLVDVPLFLGPVILLAGALLVVRRVTPPERERSQQVDREPPMP